MCKTWNNPWIYNIQDSIVHRLSGLLINPIKGNVQLKLINIQSDDQNNENC